MYWQSTQKASACRFSSVRQMWLLNGHSQSQKVGAWAPTRMQPQLAPRFSLKQRITSIFAPQYAAYPHFTRKHLTHSAKENCKSHNNSRDPHRKTHNYFATLFLIWELKTFSYLCIKMLSLDSHAENNEVCHSNNEEFNFGRTLVQKPDRILFIVEKLSMNIFW